jgi:hypothetical protein
MNLRLQALETAAPPKKLYQRILIVTTGENICREIPLDWADSAFSTATVDVTLALSQRTLDD